MFKFNFSNEDEEEHKNQDNTDQCWLQAKEVCSKELIVFLNEILSCGSPKMCSFKNTDLSVKHVCPSDVLNFLKCKNIEPSVFQRADENHSDLIPSIYEGGLKIWECTYDLINYVLSEKVDLIDKNVLDLGCGAGIAGIVALLKGSKVCFQDYNEEVIKYITIPNVYLNCSNEIENKCKFYCGDWESFSKLNKTSCEKFDYIFTSETIYNQSNYNKLHDLFKERLKENGTVYLAAKSYYFGVGGGTQQFENLLKEHNIFNSESVWECTLGIKRQILKLTFV